jgi:signal transduction histidine kinase
VEIERTGEPNGFNPQTEVQLLRIVQEALANARKHSSADRVVVEIHFSPQDWGIAVEDDGVGFDPGHPTRGPWPHFGLQSMRERAASIGAEFEVTSRPGHGTRVDVKGQYSR